MLFSTNSINFNSLSLDTFQLDGQEFFTDQKNTGEEFVFEIKKLLFQQKFINKITGLLLITVLPQK